MDRRQLIAGLALGGLAASLAACAKGSGQPVLKVGSQRGGAKAIPNQAAQLNGLDSWRRAARQIGSGMGIPIPASCPMTATLVAQLR